MLEAIYVVNSNKQEQKHCLQCFIIYIYIYRGKDKWQCYRAGDFIIFNICMQPASYINIIHFHLTIPYPPNTIFFLFFIFFNFLFNSFLILFISNAVETHNLDTKIRHMYSINFFSISLFKKNSFYNREGFFNMCFVVSLINFTTLFIKTICCEPLLESTYFCQFWNYVK